MNIWRRIGAIILALILIAGSVFVIYAFLHTYPLPRRNYIPTSDPPRQETSECNSSTFIRGDQDLDNENESDHDPEPSATVPVSQAEELKTGESRSEITSTQIGAQYEAIIDQLLMSLATKRLPEQQGPPVLERYGSLGHSPVLVLPSDQTSVKQIKEVIHESLLAGETSIKLDDVIKEFEFTDIHTGTTTVNRWLSELKLADPRLFFIDALSFVDESGETQRGFTYQYSYENTATGIRFTRFTLESGLKESYADPVNRENAYVQLSAVADQIAAAIAAATDNDYARLRLIHDFLIVIADYDETETIANNNAYSCLLDGTTMCVGYSQAFDMIARRLGFESRVISGKTRSRDGLEVMHAWNKVLLYDHWYNVDVTWDDQAGLPTFSESHHTWFLCSDTFFAHDHTPNETMQPDAPLDFLDFYYLNGLCATNEEQLLAILVEQLREPVDGAPPLIEFIVEFDLKKETFAQLAEQAYHYSFMLSGVKWSYHLHYGRGFCYYSLT
ncbi:MAG TPA: hypothetical protein GX717_08610 [Clostridiaceae bacterium]|nr:hypothetical protein [Clostridiaceae bacterium]